MKGSTPNLRYINYETKLIKFLSQVFTLFISILSRNLSLFFPEMQLWRSISNRTWDPLPHPCYTTGVLSNHESLLGVDHGSPMLLTNQSDVKLSLMLMLPRSNI